jgi:acyl-CoA thioesterase FadM
MRALNLPEKKSEKEVIFPAISVEMQYFMPAELKDEIIIKTCMVAVPQVRLLFKQSVYHPKKGLLNEANVCLASVNAKTMRATRCPEVLQKAVKATMQ